MPASADGVEYNLELPVVFLLQPLQLTGQLGIGANICRSRTNARTTWTLVSAARALFRTLASINAPCSVKT